ncbi:thiol-activated cytolysin family protein [Myroides sp. WP-1]|uniref:thiol-activated cytolysin family protein n=1 Tax=Myroides sp. WP-1 TaxID=2759944 RepID=UPI0015F90707|nr:thiol-activated cytolysin family protein [Myroides sp. WP-1]MBB1140854.1 thiol-activated cytolysin family protein [Myroides sp. WP-1]
MNRKKRGVKLALITVVQAILLSYSNEDNTTKEQMRITSESTSEIINDGPPTLLITNKINSPIISPRKMGSSNCVDNVENQEKTFDNFSKFDTGAYLMWPGNILQGQTIKTGALAAIPIGENGRNPIEVKIDAFSSNTTISSSQIIKKPTAGRVQNALEIALNSFYKSKTKFPANYTIDIQRTFSSSQLQLALNVGYTGASGVDLGASFGIDFKTSKTYYAVTLKQKFFSVSVYPKSGLQGDLGWVKTEYPSSELDQFMGKDRPPVYISSVTYGRLYTLVYESSESALELEQALNFAYKNPTIELSAEQKLKYSKTLSSSRVYVKQLGGNATKGVLTTFESQAGNFESIRDFVVKGAEVSKQNPGYPIEYSAVHVGTNQPVTIKMTAKNKYKECKQITYVADSYSKARAEVDKLKSEYGIGNSALILIHNNTDQELVLTKTSSWYRSSFYNSPPTIIPARKYGYCLTVHKTGSATGTFNQISYKFKEGIVSFGTYAPWGQFYTNNVLVDFKEITEHELYNNSDRPVFEKVKGNTRIRGRIDTGDSPHVLFTVTQ